MVERFIIGLKILSVIGLVLKGRFDSSKDSSLLIKKILSNGLVMTNHSNDIIHIITNVISSLE